MKKFIQPSFFFRTPNVDKFGTDALGRMLVNILKLNKINKVYSGIYEKSGIDFIDALIEKLDLKYDINPDELNRIPKQGAFIIISNYPFGGLDALILIKILHHIRPDIKIVARYVLKEIKPVEEFFFTTNPFAAKRPSTGVSAIKKIIEHLKGEHPVIIFPAGEVATYDTDSKRITDKRWQDSAIRFIKKSKVPVVPIYFHGTNRNLFHLLGVIHPLMRTFRLPSDLLNKRNKVLRIRIGTPITVKEQENLTNYQKYGRFLRAKTFALDSTLEVKKFFNTNIFREKKEQIIIDAVSPEKIDQEVQHLKKDYLLIQNQNFIVICAPSIEMPNTLTEIGRLREITFREVGEGTNRSSDIDEFDLYYHQLFIYDEEEKKIVGAYRVGKGKEIMTQFGVKGFYVQSLFKFSRPIFPLLNETLELGRSFIVKEYQKKPMSLFLLWKGILYFLIKNPEYRYLMGPVSISNRFLKISKNLIIEFIKSTVYDYDLAQYVKPRKKFTTKDKFDTDIVLEAADKDISKIDKFIADIEPTNFRIPVLLKKYLQQNAKIIGFNIDPKFNNALDGLMILDLYEVPINTIKSLSKEINDDSILERFQNLTT